jgi:hypothetical protein
MTQTAANIAKLREYCVRLDRQHARTGYFSQQSRRKMRKPTALPSSPYMPLKARRAEPALRSGHRKVGAPDRGVNQHKKSPALGPGSLVLRFYAKALWAAKATPFPVFVLASGATRG